MEGCGMRRFFIDMDGVLAEYDIDNFDYEVVGNIYDNPELLKGGTK